MRLFNSQVENFIVGFLDGALWSETDNSDENTCGDLFDLNYTVRDMAPETVQEAAEDCLAFLADCEAAGLADFASLILQRPDDTAEGSAGVFFLLTRNGHGAGFWDGGWKHGDELTALAEPYGTFGLYLGDDGLIYSHG